VSWYGVYENFSNKERELFRNAANRLFSRNFLVYARDEDRPYYRFTERHLDIFKEYFSLAGWDLKYNQRLSVIQLYNSYDKNRYTFTLQETIFLFILRLLYNEKEKDLRLTRAILVSGEEIREKYTAMEIKNRLPGRDDLEKSLKLFSRFSLLDLKRGQWKDPDAVYVLYPSLPLVIDASGLEMLADWIKGGEEKEDDDEDPDQD